MTPGLLDLSEQWSHVIDVMLAILQPALWLGLCAAFVLASAHLLTMLGTRWGDRRVSPKAFLFSMMVHLSLGIAIVAMIPEYRQHILSLGQEELPPVSVDLLTTFESSESPLTSAGNTPWSELPEQIRKPESRTNPVATPPDPVLVPDRPEPIELAAVRPVEPPLLPEAMPVSPTPSPAAAPVSERAPAPAALPVDIPRAEARPEAVPPEPTVQRTTAPDAAVPEMAPTRPAAAELVPDPRPARVPDQALASLTPPAPTELPQLERTPLPSMTPATPAAEPLPQIQPLVTPSPAVAGNSSPQPTAPRRTRTEALAAARDPIVQRFEPGVLPLDRFEPQRERDRERLPRREDPMLPELYRQDLDPQRALASIGTGKVPASYGLRTDQDRKDEAIRRYGGTEDSQKAVERALKWLASVQEPDGRWDADKYGAGQGPPETDSKIADRQYAGRRSDTGLTALAVLALLGNGNSLNQGTYAVNVDRAINWLISVQREDGSLAGDGARFEAMYCHGMATLALAETYAMETDALTRSTLRTPLERALAFTTSMQLEDGGWRYLAGQEGGGDMSMFGWQLMAFRSAQDGGIAIPDTMRTKLISFLSKRSRGKDGGLAGYRETDPVTPSMTAEALFCKQMLGLRRDNVMAREAVTYLIENRPRLSELNLYYWYYGTLAMFQHGGEDWQRWNVALRDLLVSQQVAEGPLAGSWDPKDAYSRYGGRLYSTALATLCLEVYYRRLPMYQWSDPAASQ